jgi:hypothetical protein
VIRKVGSGYKVLSEGGKPLSKVLKTYKQAKKRLAQVERYSNKS